MNLVKSNIFWLVVKFVALFLLSFYVAFAAPVATGGGHGNYLPGLVVYGPFNILFFIPKTNPNGFFIACLIYGTVGLYGIYALLALFVKTWRVLLFISAFHILTILVFTPFYLGSPFDLFAYHNQAAVLLFDVLFIGIPLSLIWLLIVSLYKKHNKTSFQKSQQLPPP